MPIRAGVNMSGLPGSRLVPEPTPHATVYAPMVANYYGRGITDDTNTEIMRYSYEIFVLDRDRNPSDSRAQAEFRRRYGGYSYLVAEALTSIEQRYGRIPAVPDSVRSWWERLEAERQAAAEPVVSVPGPRVKVQAQWLADP